MRIQVLDAVELCSSISSQCEICFTQSNEINDAIVNGSKHYGPASGTVPKHAQAYFLVLDIPLYI